MIRIRGADRTGRVLARIVSVVYNPCDGHRTDKSGATVASDALDGLTRLPDALGASPPAGRGVLIYGGDTRQRRSSADVVPWDAVSRVRWFPPEPGTP